MDAPAARQRTFEFRLDATSGVPVYRQIIDQVTGGVASGVLAAAAQLPTVRQVSVDLAINPNTVMRAYRELEIRGIIETQQGTGTFISRQKPRRAGAERQRQLSQLAADCIARAGAAGFTTDELLEQLYAIHNDAIRNRS
jgi:GntR family transcriptional regulator